jgi:uncharacterized membrane protein YgdD (TMEM256/DUF423 family)
MIDRLLIVLGAFAGLTGVALSAAAAHLAGGAGLATPANFLLFHAPVPIIAAMLARAGAANRWLARAAAILVVAGLVMFCGSLTLTALKGMRLFANAAPVGGVALMAGWAMLAIASLIGQRAAPEGARKSEASRRIRSRSEAGT